MISLDRSDAIAVRKLLAATQRSAGRNNAGGTESQRFPNNARGTRYRYRFDDFDDEDVGDGGRDYRDISHYAVTDPVSGKVTELWLGIIDADNDGGYWELSLEEANWLVLLDGLKHLKMSRCGILPTKQLKQLPNLKHLSLSDCGNSCFHSDDDEGQSFLPNIESFSLRYGFQPTLDGVQSLLAAINWIRTKLTNLERISICRLDHPIMGEVITTMTTRPQQDEYKRKLTEMLLESLESWSPLSSSQLQIQQISSSDDPLSLRGLKVLELNHCGLSSEDFKRILFGILPTNFPSLERLALDGNEIAEIPKIEFKTRSNTKKQMQRNFYLKELHLSNNPIMNLLGRTGSTYCYVDFGNKRENEDVSLRRQIEFEALRDLLRDLFPKLCHLGYPSCVCHLLRSEDYYYNEDPSGTFASRAVYTPTDSNHQVISFNSNLQNEIEYYLRINRGGRWLVEGGAEESGDYSATAAGNVPTDSYPSSSSSNDRMNSIAKLWPFILEWSYQTSSGGCFLTPLSPFKPHPRISIIEEEEKATTTSAKNNIVSNNAVATAGVDGIAVTANKNATSLFHLLREGPALCGGERRR